MAALPNPGRHTRRPAKCDGGDIPAGLDHRETGLRDEALACLDGLFGYAMSLSQNQVEAEELVQQSYMSGVRSFRRLAPGSSVKTWLYAILRDLWLDRAQHAHSGLECLEADDPDREDPTLHSRPGEEPIAVCTAKIDPKRVRTAVQQLPVPHREVILLREFEGLTYEEIGAILNCRVGTVMSRLGRARQKLRTLLSCTA